MKTNGQNLMKSLFAISILLLLSACGSELTGIDAPPTVEVGVPFQASVTHQFIDSPESADPSYGGPAGVPIEDSFNALVFGVFVPTDYTGNPLANYQGVWDGVPVDLDMALQAGIPATNFVEFLQNDGAPVELVEYADASDCNNVIEDLEPETEGFKLLFYRTTADITSGPSPQTGDGGEFFFELTPGATGNDGVVVVIHGLMLGESNPDAPDGSPEEIQGCQWYPDPLLPDPLELFIPDSEVAQFIAFASEPMPVPMMGGAMIAVLASLLAVVGVMAGRRRREHQA